MIFKALLFVCIIVGCWRLLSESSSGPKYEVSTLLHDNDYLQKLDKLGLTRKRGHIVRDSSGREKKVFGRFVHITDFHPDPHYKEGSSIDEACHGGEGDASKYGDAVKGCDSPTRLVKETVKWVQDNLKDKVDFIVWTGDNVRHDNDRKYPRTEMQIFDLNQEVSDLMYDTFKSNDSQDPRAMDVDIIPSLGNNDVYPHNLFAPGPTLQTREMYKIWEPFVPQSQLHIFNRGVYFFQEVIPNQLAVLSINTLYWFQSNPLVDNCDNRKQPGYKMFEWLSYVLSELRSRNMKVWLSGHVPPNEKNYDISCLRKYIVWTHEYRDIIVGGLYGHMNIDHFIPLDSKSAWKSLNKSLKDKKKKGSKREIEHGDYEDELDNFEELSLEDFYKLQNVPESGAPPTIQGGVPKGKVEYLESLRHDLYASIKGVKKSGKHAERYSIAHVGSSVVPTFNSGIRVWEYNITGLIESYDSKANFAPWDEFFNGLDKLMIANEFKGDKSGSIFNYFVDKPQVESKKKDKTIPPRMPANLPLGPAYVPQLFTPERYVQYYADLASINKGEKPFGYEIEYMTDDSIYDMKDLTVEEWLKFGRKLGRPLKKSFKNKAQCIKNGMLDCHNMPRVPIYDTDDEKSKLEDIWRHYLHYSFISSNYETMNIE